MMMRKIGAMAAVALAMVVPAQAQLLVYEGCDYTAGESFFGDADWDPTGGKDGGTGWGEAWQGKNGQDPTVGKGLTYTDLPDVGGSAYAPGKNGGQRMLGRDAIDQWTTNNTVWFSMLVAPDEGKSEFTARFYTTYRRSSVWAYWNRGIGFDLRDPLLDISGSVVQASLGGARGGGQLVDPTRTNLIVGKIEMGDAAGEFDQLITTTLTVWANPVIVDGEPTSGGSVVTRDMGPAYESDVGDYLAIYGGGEWGGAVDEIRLGMTFDDVVGGGVEPVDRGVEPVDGDVNGDGAVDGNDFLQEATAEGLGVPVEKTLDLGKSREGEDVTMKLVLIPAGEFMMGCSDELMLRKHDAKDEGPRRQVTLTKPFYMSVCEVTQEQYERVTGGNPSRYKAKQNPVECVSWEDAVWFCKRLSAQTGLAVRLPTEAQWEYACRAGTDTPFHTGETIWTDQANFNGSYDERDGQKGLYRGKTLPVGSFEPNAFGLYDMHGNVWEWCADRYRDSYHGLADTDPKCPAGKHRPLRGGCWYDGPVHVRSTSRHKGGPTGRASTNGFRVVVYPASVDVE